MMPEPVWIQDLAVRTIHSCLISQFGGSEGVRDQGLLESALARPRNRFAYGSTALPELAASYAFGICRNHPFVDGNERTSLAVAGAFLERNASRLAATQEDAYLTFLVLAAGEITEEQLAAWFLLNTVPIPR